MSTPANETPRTDAQLAMVNDECRISGDDTFAEVSAWDFARQLERELNEAREQIATLRAIGISRPKDSTRNKETRK